MIARWEWRRKDHSLINKDDYSATLSDAERKKSLSEMSSFQRRLMRARGAETERIVHHEM